MSIKIVSNNEIEKTINDYYEWLDDINDIECVDDVVETFYEFIRYDCPDADIDLNINNIRVYYGVNTIDELNEKFVNDVKIETVDNCIRLMLMPAEVLDEFEYVC